MLLGARQAGKTTLSRRVRPDWRYVDLENAADHDLVIRRHVRPGVTGCTSPTAPACR